MQARVIQMIWDAAAAGGYHVPLFPGVKRLRVDSTIEVPEPTSPPPEGGVLIFNGPNVCRFDEPNVFRELSSLPAGEYHINCHVREAHWAIYYIDKFGVPSPAPTSGYLEDPWRSLYGISQYPLTSPLGPRDNLQSRLVPLHDIGQSFRSSSLSS